MFALDGYRVARLTLSDAADVQSLYERCNDYHVAHEGTPTRATAGVEELTSTPPGRSVEDKFPFGIYAVGGELIGYLELFRDYPADGEWWIGLLMLDPKVRRRGLGSMIVRAATSWAAANGAQAIELAALEGDPAAQSFWRRQGFEFARRRSYESQAQKKCHTVLVLRRALDSPTSA
jgi:GNAT superfamily N-acetyltransferase